MDLTNAPANSWVSMKVWWESEFSWDGANLQSSNDGGSTWNNVGAFGDANNWYNDNTINGNPGGSGEGWTGRNSTSDGSGGWVVAANALDPSLIGSSSVRFRVNFGSDGSVFDEGFAFDDFTISVPPTVDLGDSIVLCGGGMLDAGNPGSTYSWSTGETSQTINVAMTGMEILDSMLFVTVVDSFGLTGTDTVYVTVPATVPTATAMTMANVDCFGDSTGMATAMATGGTGPYMYSWNTSPAQMGDMATMLAAGSYTVTVVDSFGCESTATATVTEGAALTVEADSVMNVQCPDDSTGVLSVSAAGGTGPLTYTWSNASTTSMISGLPVGDYTVMVVDSLGCTITSDTLAIVNTDMPPVAAFSTGPVGSVINFMNTSTGGLTYMWDFGDDSTSTDENPQHTYLANDTYIVTLTVTNDCGSTTATDTIVMNQVGIEDDLLAQAVSVYPNPNQGSFEVNFKDITLEGVSIRVHTLNGQVVYTKQLGDVYGSHRQTINLTQNLAKGVYVLEIRSVDAVSYKRFILE